ncbi:hypothetical protein NicSoilC5_08820 [Arthrobacter sp. NicSoilC5]|nr:hypothetical protein NicSoilC5_08820 [Arthrobacter sp. NicSoilC5]
MHPAAAAPYSWRYRYQYATALAPGRARERSDLDLRRYCPNNTFDWAAYGVLLKFCCHRRVGGRGTSFDVDIMPVNAATEPQNMPSAYVLELSDVHHIIFSDPNDMEMKALSDPPVPKALLMPAFSHR